MGMLNRTRGTGVCPCNDCNGVEDYGDSKYNRLREKREWRKDLALPSWSQLDREYHSRKFDANLVESYPPPDGFNGVWSTSSPDVSHG